MPFSNSWFYNAATIESELPKLPLRHPWFIMGEAQGL